MSDNGAAPLAELELALGYKFKDQSHLEEALTHSSVAHEAGNNYERLEFLGDAVIGLVAAELLWELFPQSPEGRLSKRKAHLISRDTLSEVARDKGFAEFVRLGHGEEQSGMQDNPNLLADITESILGAVFLDAGWATVRQIAREWLKDRSAADHKPPVGDHKSALQELTQGRWKVRPSYTVRQVSGPGHAQTFEVEVKVKSFVVGRGVGSSKKRAEQAGAEIAMKRLSGVRDPQKASLDT